MPRRRTGKKKKTDPVRTAFMRYMVIVAVLIMWIGIIGVRLVHLQVSEHEWLKSKAIAASQYKHERKILRGTIFDRDGKTLAISIRVKSLFADPTLIEDPSTVAQVLGKTLKVRSSSIEKKIRDYKEKGRKFLWIKRRLSGSRMEDGARA